MSGNKSFTLHDSPKKGTDPDPLEMDVAVLDIRNKCTLLKGARKDVSPQDVLNETDIIEANDSSPDISTYEIVENELVVRESDIDELLKTFRENQFNASVDAYEKKFGNVYCICKGLFDKDYHCDIVDNYGGTICNNYPTRLIIPVAPRGADRNCEGLLQFDKEKYKTLAEQSCLSRCRSRFVVPVIFSQNKFICRSATLSVKIGAAFESALKEKSPPVEKVEQSLLETIGQVVSDMKDYIESNIWTIYNTCKTVVDSEAVKNLDIELLKTVNVEFICDLMMENRKMFYNLAKLRLASRNFAARIVIQPGSAELQRAKPFNRCLLVGMASCCEFFTAYHENKRNPAGLLFDWNHEYIDADLELSDNSHAETLNITLANYKSWDIVELTKNYMKILLSYFVQGTGGLLVHCISGWDRTPLIISLLRMSLWADGVIHESLSGMEMVYLTLGYDWFLFGHDLPKRLVRKEEIMHFCFKFLPEIATDEYSATRIFQEMIPELKGNRKFPEFTEGRRNVLRELSEYVLSFYDRSITMEMGYKF